MKHLFIIDAVNLLFRAYYAIQPMSTPQGVPTHALFGFIRSIYKLVTDFSPDLIIAVFDGPDNKKSRIELYAPYKGHRKQMPEDLFPQLEKALSWCPLAGIPFLAVPGVEADDTIGSMAVWAVDQGMRVKICSSDKDLCQLVSDKIHVINVGKDNLEIDRDKVKELFGVTPEQFVDYLAIVGDSSDNIPGLEGFGPKTAAGLLQEFGTLDAILAHPEKIKGEKKQTVVREGREIALLSRKLAALQLNVDFPKKESFFHRQDPRLDELNAFYQEMHFLSLIKETAARPHYHYHLVTQESDLQAVCQMLREQKEFCLDVETTDICPMKAHIVGIGLGWEPDKIWYVPLNGPLDQQVVLKAVESVLSDPEVSIFGHNIKYDMHALANISLSQPQISFDTILASYLISPQQQKHNLDQLTLEKFQVVKTPIEDLIGKGKEQTSMADVALDKICDYCSQDVDYTIRLKKTFAKELAQQNLEGILEEIELPLIPVLLRMERRGIYIDVKQLQAISIDLSKELHHLETEIYHFAGEKFNINSPKQLGAILFDKMGISPPKKTATGYSTSAEVLEELQESIPLAKAVLHYRTLEKLRSTYVDALPKNILPSSGRIHTTFNQFVAATGRLSSQDPNLQNIPIRSPAGKKIRSAFKPQEKGWSFVSADYSQIELRLLAHLSEDPALLKAFNAGEDVHAFTASLVFDTPLTDVTPEMRQRAKAVNFGILYGQQAFGLSQGVGISYKEASQFIEKYFQRYKRVREFLEFCKESVRKTGYAITITGRKRPIPDILSKNGVLRALSERFAINTPLQGAAADLIKLAMIEIDRMLLANKRGYMLLQIHDELLFETTDDQTEALSLKVKSSMEHVMKLKVPLEVHISIGKNWEEC